MLTQSLMFYHIMQACMTINHDDKCGKNLTDLVSKGETPYDISK